MLTRLLTLLSLLLIFAAPASAQLGSVPAVFSAGSVISSSAMNTNFSTVYSNALNRTGGTMTGSLTTLGLLPTTDNASDIGSAALSYNDAWFDGTVTIATLAATSLTLATDLPITEGGTGSSSASAARTALGLIIGTDIQAFNTNLTAINQALTTTSSPSFTAVTAALTGTIDSNGSGTRATFRNGSGDGLVIAQLNPDSWGITGQDANTTLSFRDTNVIVAAKKFGAGMAQEVTPAATIQALSTTEQFRSSYDASNYMSVTTSSVGTTVLDLVGTSPFFQFNDLAVFTTNSGVIGPEGVSAVFNIVADESDDVGDRWTFTATDGSTAGSLTVASSGSTGSSNFDIFGVDDMTITAGEGLDLEIRLVTDDGDDANDTWTISTPASNSFNISNPGGGTFSIAATGAITIPYLASSSGTRFVCSDTNGTLTDSASACSGTDPDALAAELAELRGQMTTLLGQRQSWAAAPAQAPKAPVAVSSNATTVPAGRGLGFWFTLGGPGGACDQANPAANDFVGIYQCLESAQGRSSASGSGGLFGSNVVLTVYGGYNITVVGYEADIQNVSGEGVNVPAAWATDGKVGFGAVLASHGGTNGDGSAGVSVTINGTDTNDRWRYGVEAGGTRAAAFYARKSTNLGDVNPVVAFFNDTDASVFLRTTGAHTKVLDSQYVDIFGTQDGRIDIIGLNPVMNFYEYDQPTNGKFWRYQVAGGDFTIETVNDAYTAAARVIAFKRTGEVNIPALAGNGERQVCAQSDGTLSICVGSQR